MTNLYFQCSISCIYNIGWFNLIVPSHFYIAAFIWAATDSIMWPFLIGGGVMAVGTIPFLVARLLQTKKGKVKVEIVKSI